MSPEIKNTIYINAEEVADLLDLTTQTVYKLASIGTLKSVRLSKKCLRFNPQDLFNTL